MRSWGQRLKATRDRRQRIELYPIPALLLNKNKWGLAYPDRATEADWRPLLDEMTDTQRLVHLTARMTADDVTEIGDRLFTEGREAYRESISAEISRWGCTGRAVGPVAGPELTAIRERADWAATSITGTYNLNLAKEIIRIGADTPTANRNTYAFRLFKASDSWDALYWQRKQTEVAQVETMTMINAATADFYVRNGDMLQPTANVIPQMAVCPICQAMVDGNPWPSVDEVYRQFDVPPHLNCPHYVDATPDRRLTADECRQLWVGV